MSDDATPAKVRLTDGLGPAVPSNVMAYLHAYGDSRADDDGLSGLRIGETILALRRWSADVQAAERERCVKLRTVADQVLRDMQAQEVLPEWQTLLDEALRA